MRIVSDNPQILEELRNKLKHKNIVVEPIEVVADKDDKGVLKDIAQLIIENPEESQVVIELIIDELTKLYRQEHIYVVKKDGKKIPYAEYKKMSAQERSEHIF